MLDFSELQARLLAGLHVRLRNGEITERSLARRIGLSQSHVHNVLAGQRDLTIEVADLILSQLQMSVLDLLDRNEVMRHMTRLVETPAEPPITPDGAGPLRDKSRGPDGQSSPS